METVSLRSLSEQIEALRRQVEALTERLTQIEGPAPAAQPKEEGISGETLTILAAAVAAYLGKRAPIRQVRLAGSQAWAQQGRAFIQASHRIEIKPSRE
jgi:methylmalonyl-CoA carboxyltransferase large subunit